MQGCNCEGQANIRDMEMVKCSVRRSIVDSQLYFTPSSTVCNFRTCPVGLLYIHDSCSNVNMTKTLSKLYPRKTLQRATIVDGDDNDKHYNISKLVK